MFKILFLITTLICCLQINAQITFPGGSSQTGGQPGGSSQTGGQPGGSSQTGRPIGGSSQAGGKNLYFVNYYSTILSNDIGYISVWNSWRILKVFFKTINKICMKFLQKNPGDSRLLLEYEGSCAHYEKNSD